MSKHTVLVSPEIAKNIEELRNDPIIVKMTHEILTFVLNSGVNVEEYLSDWNIVSAANKEYHSRGGSNSKTIGAPAEAIKSNLIALTSTCTVEDIINLEHAVEEVDEFYGELGLDIYKINQITVRYKLDFSRFISHLIWMYGLSDSDHTSYYHVSLLSKSISKRVS